MNALRQLKTGPVLREPDRKPYLVFGPGQRRDRWHRPPCLSFAGIEKEEEMPSEVTNGMTVITLDIKETG
ncbi:MAG: hypothetical protein L0338_22965, partial [Acidobacteria bacterium]|nr:hypothetical protein [Acidobacteriota bacterium]